MPTIKKLYFASGVSIGSIADLTSESSTVHVGDYVDDAAFVAANGTAQAGDLYINTTFQALRLYTGSAWRTVTMSTNAADPTKTWLVDLDGASTGTSATLDFNQTASRVYTFPDFNGQVILNTNTETSPTLLAGATGTTTIGNASGTVVIPGSLEVQGTTTTLNTLVVEAEDKNILVNKGGNDTTAQGAGLTVERAGTFGSFIYDSVEETKWKAGNVGSEVGLVDKSTAQTLTNKTMSGASNTFSNIDLTASTVGTLGIARGGTGQTTANAALNALLPSQTSQSGKVLKTDGTNTSWQDDLVGGGSSELINLVSGADYTITDIDGYTTILVNTNGANRTITLPTLADNQNRVIRIKKVFTSGSETGTVTIDGEGSELIDNSANFTLYFTNESIVVQASSTRWVIVSENANPANFDRLTDTEATKLGLYRYQAGTTYAASLSLTINRSFLGYSSFFLPYQAKDGTWFMKFQISVLLNGSFTTATITVSGVTWAQMGLVASAPSYQSISATGNGVADTMGIASIGSGDLLWYGATSNNIAVSGELQLTAKPTWAY